MAYFMMRGLKSTGDEEVEVRIDEAIIKRPTGDYYKVCFDIDTSKLPEGVTKVRVEAKRD